MSNTGVGVRAPVEPASQERFAEHRQVAAREPLGVVVEIVEPALDEPGESEVVDDLIQVQQRFVVLPAIPAIGTVFVILLEEVTVGDVSEFSNQRRAEGELHAMSQERLAAIILRDVEAPAVESEIVL